jgi:hypothetical protein
MCVGDSAYGRDGYYEQWLSDSVQAEQEESGLQDEEAK